MGMIQSSLGGISGGVSQQPDILRYPGQCTEQTNMVVDLVEGLRRRGDVSLINILDPAFTSGDAFIHWFSLHDTDYVAVFTSTGVKVFDVLGNPYTTVVPSYSYMSSGFDSKNISSAQVGEYNMIANSIVPPAMSTSVDDDGDEYVTFHISDGMAWGVRYTIEWNGTTVADYTAPDGSTVDATTTEKITSLYIAADLFADVSAYATPLGWTCVLQGNVIIMKRLHADYQTTGNALSWTIDDSSGGQEGSCTATQIQTLDELPPKSWPGHWVRVNGKSKDSIDDFYMMYETDDGTYNTEGVWKESHDPTEVASFDPITMPHALIKVASGVFYFTPLNGTTYGGSVVDTWASRSAGDSDSNPEPSFIGQAIYDMTIVQQRLVLVTDDHVNMSKTQGEFTWWSSSALSDVDTDPIELTTPGERAAHLFHAIEHEQNLLVLGDKRQFAVPLRNALTRANASLVPTTSYDVDSECSPTAAAGGMFFAFSDGNRSGVREYRTGNVDSIHVADEVTSHIGTYLPPALKMLEADRQNGVIVAVPYTGTDLYYYQFLEENQQKVMSAWSKITLNGINPRSLMSLDGHFYIIGVFANGLGLYRLNVPGDIFLDYQTTALIASDGTVDFSSWPFAATSSADDLIAVLQSGPYDKLRVEIDTFIGGVITLKERTLFAGETLLIGVKYASSYTPTMPVLRDKDGKAVQVDRLTVNFIEVQVEASGAFEVVTHADYYEDTLQEFSGMSLGTTFIVGERPVSTRKEQISVGHDARRAYIKLTTNNHTDLIIQALEYKGAYTRRGMRV